MCLGCLFSWLLNIEGVGNDDPSAIYTAIQIMTLHFRMQEKVGAHDLFKIDFNLTQNSF